MIFVSTPCLISDKRRAFFFAKDQFSAIMSLPICNSQTKLCSIQHSKILPRALVSNVRFVPHFLGDNHSCQKQISSRPLYRCAGRQVTMMSAVREAVTLPALPALGGSFETSIFVFLGLQIECVLKLGFCCPQLTTRKITPSATLQTGSFLVSFFLAGIHMWNPADAGKTCVCTVCFALDAYNASA